MKLKQLLISTASIAALAVVPMSIVSCGNTSNSAVEELPSKPGGDNNTQQPGGDNNTQQPGGDNNTQQPGGDNNTQQPGGDNNTQQPGGDNNGGETISKPMQLNQETFDCGVFNGLNQKTESIIDMINKIKTTDLIYLNRETIFSNYEDLDNNRISKIDAWAVFEKSQIRVEISYKNEDLKTNFWIQLSDDNLLRFSQLSDIHKWPNSKTEQIGGYGYSYTVANAKNIVLDETIKLINKAVGTAYKNYPPINGGFIKKIGGQNNAFTMELNPNGTFTNSELLYQFPKIFSSLGQTWTQAVNTLGTFPNVDKIKNIIVEFNAEMSGIDRITAPGTNVNVKIVPVKTTVIFEGTTPDITWHFSKDLQNEKSYQLSMLLVVY